MLVKAFELKHEFPFDMSEGTVVLDREQLIPTTQHRSSAIADGRVHIIKPNLGNKISLFGVTHGQRAMSMVVLSSGSATRYYWFTKSRRYTYLAPMGSKDLDEAWVHLFKSFMLDSDETSGELYEILKDFTLEYIQTLGDKEFKYDLSGKWREELVHVTVEKQSFMNKQVVVTTGDKTRTCDFGKHPLVEMIG